MEDVSKRLLFDGLDRAVLQKNTLLNQIKDEEESLKGSRLRLDVLNRDIQALQHDLLNAGAFVEVK